ncbi:MAG: ATP-binding cassette domain-containing protein, partial [Armatimonadetes bacterium]|nr:ATP-binding cassette domain-containing protein [Armatimonadota bacterium]
GLACALIHLPDILLLDEPTTGVDPLSRRDFWQIMGRLGRERGMTVLLTTPYLDEAERCHRVALMARGRLLVTGSPEALKSQVPGRPRHEPALEDLFVALMAPRDGPPPFPSVQPVPAAPRAAPEDARIVEVRGLTKRFGAVTAVEDVTFDVLPGEIFGLLGPNGAGKTTTIKMLTGILRPTGGHGWIAGYDVGSQAEEVKAAIGYMSQRFSLYPDLTVTENLGLYARVYGLASRRKRERQEAVIATVGLVPWRGALARDLPLGIRQRLALACAILHEPRILFLDEPTSGVDPLARQEFWNLIVTLSRTQKVTILVTTHYMKETERCDRLALIHRGRLVALGEPGALRRQAEAHRGRVLEVDAPGFREAAAALEAAYPDLALFGRRSHLRSLDPDADRQRVLAVLAHAGAGEAQVRTVPMSMDEVFATLIESGGGDRAVA